MRDQTFRDPTTFITARSTDPFNYRIYARPQSIKQARRPEFYKYIDLEKSYQFYERFYS